MNRRQHHRSPVRVILYTTRQCGHCRRLKRFLQSREIRFTEYDVERSRRAWSAFQRAGGRSVPLILVGEHRLAGFDPERLSRVLRQAGLDA